MDGASQFATPARAEAPRAAVPPPVRSDALSPPPRDWPAAGIAGMGAVVAQQLRAAGGTAGASPHASLPSPSPQKKQPAAAAHSDSSVELVLRPMPSRAASLVGRRVARWRWWCDYPGKHGSVLQGVIEEALPPARQDGWRWRVRFEDGTAEEIAWPALQTWLVCDDDGGDAVKLPAAQPGVPPPPLAPAGASTEQKTGKQYKGVSVSTSQVGSGFRMVGYFGGQRVEMWPFVTAEEAARAYDDGRRRHGLRVVNFPRAGTNEVQAVPYEADSTTLRRVEQGVDHTRHRAPPQRSTRSKLREASPTALRSTRALKAVDTPVAPPPPHAAAAQSSPLGEDVDPLVGRLVSLPYRETSNARGCVCTHYDGVVVAKRAAGAYDVQLNSGYMEKGVSTQFVLKHTITSAEGAAGAAGGVRAPRQRGAMPLKRKRLTMPAASDDNVAATPSEELSAPVAICPGTAPSAAAPSDAAAFLRGVKPPLQDLDAILHRLHATDLTMTYLAMAAQQIGAPSFAVIRSDLFKALEITRVTDQLAFTVALSALTP